MKKMLLMVTIILSMVLIVSGCKLAEKKEPPVGVIISGEDIEEPYVDPEIYELLKTESKVRAIITVSNESNMDRILEELGNEDFELIRVLALRPSFVGYITNSGITKLKEDETITSIIFDGTVSIPSHPDR